MNQSEKRGSLNRVSSKNRIPFGFTGTSAVLAVAIMGWCGAIQGAEIHEAAELGDLERVKAYLAQDPKQIDLVDAKGPDGAGPRRSQRQTGGRGIPVGKGGNGRHLCARRLSATLTRLPLF